MAGDSGGDLAQLREIRCALRCLLAARARSTRCEYLAGVTWVGSGLGLGLGIGLGLGVGAGAGAGLGVGVGVGVGVGLG